jgi:hypothetical protein
MAQIIQGGVEAFDLMLYPDQHPRNDQYIQAQFDLSNPIYQALNDFGRQFMLKSKETYENLQNSEALRIARAAIRQTKNLFKADTILELKTLEELQAAQPTMQRWLMSNPTIRELYLQQRCHGFKDTYHDPNPEGLRATDYNWRRVMTGVVEETEGGDWTTTQYLEELLPDDVELTHDQKVDILSTWDVANLFLSTGFDVTDPWGGKL